MINVIQNTIGSLRKASSTPSFTGLLDTYSGAAVGYSLRKLSNTYSGDAIIVRRASDNLELAIGFINNELDTASLITHCTGTDGFITTWYDQSGNGKDAVQGSDSNQPIIYVNGVGIITKGTKPALKANSNTGYLAINTAISFTDFAIANVYSEKTTSAMTWGNGVSYYAMHHAEHRINSLITSNTPIPSAGDYILDFVNRNSGAVEVFLNNASKGTATVVSTYEFKQLLNGHNLTWGYTEPMQEFILWTSEQSANRIGIQDNINTHYSIY